MTTRIAYHIAPDDIYHGIVILTSSTNFKDFVFANKIEENNVADIDQTCYSEGSFMINRDIYIEQRYWIVWN